MEPAQGLEIGYLADLPAWSGLGSSSSFVVGLLNSLSALQGKMTRKHELALEAIRVEQSVMNEAVGSQDQTWAAYGGMNRIDFHEDGTLKVSPLILDPEVKRQLGDSLMLFFTGFSRDGPAVAGKQIAGIERAEIDMSYNQACVDQAMSILTSGNNPVAEFGRLMHESWMKKRSLTSGISTDVVDDIYSAAMDAGALGGKLLGAGGGGFILFVVEPDRQDEVRERLQDLIHVQFEFDTEGSKIAVYEPSNFGF